MSELSIALRLFFQALPPEIRILSIVIAAWFLGMSLWAGVGVIRARLRMQAIVRALGSVEQLPMSQREHGLSLGGSASLREALSAYEATPWWEAVKATMVEYDTGVPRTIEPMNAPAPSRRDVQNYTGVFVTTPLDQVISMERLVGTPSWHRFYRLVPGVTTSLGLFGTFLALLLGLAGVEVMPDSTVVGTDVLINNLSGKFFTSVGAIALGVMALLFESVIQRSLAVGRHTVVESLDRRLPMLTTNRLLVEMHVLAKSQARSLDSINSDFALELGNLFRDSVAPAMAAQVTSSMASELGAGLTPLLKELRESLERLTETVHRLESSKQESVVGEVRAVVSSINDSLNATLNAMGAQFREALGSSTQEQFGDLRRILEGSTTALEGMTDSFRSLRDGLSEVVENAKSATATQFESGSAQIQRMQEMMESLIGGLQSSATHNVSAVSAALSEAVAGLSSQMLELGVQVSAAVRNSAEQSASASTRALSQAETWTKQTGDQLERILASMEAKASLLDSAAIRVGESRLALEEGLRGASSALESLISASAQVRGYTKDLAEAQGELSAGQQAQRQVADRARELLEEVRVINGGHQSLLAEQQRLLSAYQAAMSSLDEDLQQVLSTVSGEMRKYSEAMQRNFESVVEYGNTHIPEFTGTIKDGTAQLSEGLEELADAIEKATRRIGPENG